jgi:hypothetical protein
MIAKGLFVACFVLLALSVLIGLAGVWFEDLFRGIGGRVIATALILFGASVAAAFIARAMGI